MKYEATDALKSCTCSSYPFPHRANSGKCGKRKELECTCEPENDPYGTGDKWLTVYNPENCKRHAQ